LKQLEKLPSRTKGPHLNVGSTPPEKSGGLLHRMTFKVNQFQYHSVLG